MEKLRFFMEERLAGAKDALAALQAFKPGDSLILHLSLERGGDLEFRVTKVGQEHPNQRGALVAVGKVTKSPPHQLMELTYAIRVFPDGSAGIGTAAAVEQ